MFKLIKLCGASKVEESRRECPVRFNVLVPEGGDTETDSLTHRNAVKSHSFLTVDCKALMEVGGCTSPG